MTLTTAKFRPSISLQVVDPDAVITQELSSNTEYYYPHEIPGKVASLADIKAALEKISGDTTTKFAKLGNEFKKLDCMYEIWDRLAILDDASDFRNGLDQEELILIEKHKVAIYGAFLSSSKQWGTSMTT